MRKHRVVMALTLAVTLTAGACASDDPTQEAGVESATEGSNTVLSASTADPPRSLLVGEPTDDEIAGLQFMREEEKMARDVYVALYDDWGATIFSNIADAEQTHMDAVETILDRYELDDPADGMAVGEFADSSIQANYDEYVEIGSESLIDALLVGAIIEERDIIDLRARETTQVDIAQVYEHLELGSQNHLRAFVRQLSRHGVDYVPLELSQELFDEIMASSTAPSISRGSRAGQTSRGGQWRRGNT